jgi:hypothetical protein
MGYLDEVHIREWPSLAELRAKDNPNVYDREVIAAAERFFARTPPDQRAALVTRPLLVRRLRGGQVDAYPKPLPAAPNRSPGRGGYAGHKPE